MASDRFLSNPRSLLFRFVGRFHQPTSLPLSSNCSESSLGPHAPLRIPMTTLNRLALQGIRSYDSEKPEVIAFDKPLTVIVGANGSGKTTIIEALKYITTGTSPPLSDAGKSFIHDPKIENSALVHAQIKLAFTTADERQIIAMRSFQLASKIVAGKEKREFKATEAVVRSTDKNGKIESVSSTMSEMEKLVPELLGVSKAVLENVIFCHQEDSTWPLSEGKILKEKFDDIFAATRYTKALKAIKDLHKKLAGNVKSLASDLTLLKSHRSDAHQLLAQIAKIKQTVQLRHDEMVSYDDEITKLQEVVDQYTLNQGQLVDIERKIDKHEAMMSLQLEELQKLEAQEDREITDPLDELKRVGIVFEEKRTKMLLDLQKAIGAVRKTEDEIAVLEREQREGLKAQGRIESLQEDNNRKKASLAQHLKSGKLDFGINSSKLPENENENTTLIDMLSALSDERLKALSRSEEAYQRDADELQGRISDLKTEQLRLTEQRRIQSEQQASFLAKRTDMATELKALEKSIASKSDAQIRLNKVNTQLDNSEFVSGMESAMAQLASLKEQITVEQRELAELRQEEKASAHLKDMITAVRMQKDTLNTLRIEHNALLASVQKFIATDRAMFSQLKIPVIEALPASLSTLIQAITDINLNDSEYASPRLDSPLKKIIEHTLSNLSAKRQTVNNVHHQAESIASSLNDKKKEANDLHNSLLAVAKSIDELNLSINVTDSSAHDKLNEQLVKKERSLEKSKSRGTKHLAYAEMFEGFAQIGKDEHECPVCARRFATDAELETFLEKTQEMIKQSRMEREHADSEKMRRLELEISNLQKAKAGIQEYTSLLLRLNDTEANIKALSDGYESASRHINEAESELDSAAAKNAEMEQASRQLEKLSDKFNQIILLIHAIVESERSIQHQSGDRSIEDVMTARETIEKSITELNTAKDNAETKLGELREVLQRLREEKSLLEMQSIELRQMQTERDRLDKDFRQTLEHINKIKNTIMKLDQGTVPIKQKLETTHNELKSVQDDWELKKHCIMEEVEKINGTIKDIKHWTAEVRSSNAELDTMQAEIRRVENTKSVLEELQHRHHIEVMQREQISNKIEKLEQQIRLIKNNINVREAQNRIKEIEASIRDLQNKKFHILGMAMQDPKRTREILLKAKTEKSRLEGTLTTLKDQCTDYINRLQSEKYRDIDRRYKDKLIEHTTTEMAVIDLATYHMALEQAVMHFHQAKMKEINELLRDYWRTVYRGQDIDEICIISDVTVADKRRSYNYRVVMKQGDTELDMRGRCSAGQKVLASLLIRLALADVFCLNCGVLALDEPTTNLDAKHIRQLAHALNDVIEKRRDQSNFQLIVITHDEAFVDEIGQRSHADYYYRVSKDPEKNVSIIRRQRLQN